MSLNKQEEDTKISYEVFKKQVLQDYEIVVTSRECSILGRKKYFQEKENLEFLVTEKKYPR